MKASKFMEAQITSMLKDEALEREAAFTRKRLIGLLSKYGGRICHDGLSNR